MNTHSLRPMISRRNVAPFTVFFVVIIVAAFGFTAGTLPSSASVDYGGGRGSQLPPGFSKPDAEDARKDFDDDDLKVKDQKPRGKWAFVLETDMEQFRAASAPVALGTVETLSGGGKYAGVIKIKRLEIKNRSSKALNSVQLRWEIVGLDYPEKVLLEGSTPFINLWAEAGSSQVIEIPTLYPSLLFKPLAKQGELNGQFQLTIGVQEAHFADGSFWKRQSSTTGAAFHHFDWFIA